MILCCKDSDFQPQRTGCFSDKINLRSISITYKNMKRIEIAAAVIRRGNRIIATQRGYGEFKGGWEFPGGSNKE